MGFHYCPKPAKGYIHNNEDPYFSDKSSGDNELTFTSGTTWRFPDALAYYLIDCGWQPPKAFVDDVMTESLIDSDRRQTRGMRRQTKGPEKRKSVGYIGQAELDKDRGWSRKDVSFADFVTTLFSVYPELNRTNLSQKPIEEIVADVAPYAANPSSGKAAKKTVIKKAPQKAHKKKFRPGYR